MPAGQAVGDDAHAGVDVEFGAVGLRLLPAPHRRQRGELVLQLARVAAQALGQRLRLGFARHHRLQAAKVGFQGTALPVPFGQRDAGAELDVVLGGGGQVEVEAHLRGDALVIFHQAQLVERFGGAAGIRILVVVERAIDAQVFRPGQDAFGTEHQDHRRLVIRRFGALGLVALVGGLLLLGLFAAFGIGGWLVFLARRLGGGRRGIEPERHGLQRLGLGARQRRQSSNAARFAQCLAHGAFLRRLVVRQLFGRNALGQQGIDQTRGNAPSRPG